MTLNDPQFKFSVPYLFIYHILRNVHHPTYFYTALCAVKCGSCGKITALSAEMNSNFVHIIF